MKVIVAGIRYSDPDAKTIFDDYALVAKAIEDSGFDVTEVVCGKAVGADTLGEQWATMKGIPVCEMPANWNRDGKAAGPIRNKAMADYADAAVIVWDGTSKGTYNMVQNMIKAKKSYYLVLTGTDTLMGFV